MLFKVGVERKLTEIYNPLVPGEGMKQLLLQNTNLLNTIKSIDNKTPNEILRDQKPSPPASPLAQVNQSSLPQKRMLRPLTRLIASTLCIRPPLAPRWVLPMPSQIKLVRTSPIPSFALPTEAITSPLPTNFFNSR